MLVDSKKIRDFFLNLCAEADIFENEVEKMGDPSKIAVENEENEQEEEPII